MKVNLEEFPDKGHRNIDINIENHDTWNLDHTLALLILPALIQLKNTAHGIPNEFGNVGGQDWEQQDSFDFYKESYNDAFQQGVDRWHETLDKMIWSFQQIAIEDYDEKYHHGTIEIDWKKSNHITKNPLTGKDEDMYEMVDKNPKKHWYDVVGHLEHEARIQEGLDLFAKYYRNLWD